MPQSITEIGDVTIEYDHFRLVADCGEIFVYEKIAHDDGGVEGWDYDDDKEYNSVTEFFLENCTYNLDEFMNYLDTKIPYHLMAEYCADEIEDWDTLMDIVSGFVPKIHDIWESVTSITKRGKTFKDYKDQIEGNPELKELIIKRVESNIDGIVKDLRIQEYLIDLFRSSDSYAEMRIKASDKELKKRMQKLKKSYLDACHNVLKSTVLIKPKKNGGNKHGTEYNRTS